MKHIVFFILDMIERFNEWADVIIEEWEARKQK